MFRKLITILALILVSLSQSALSTKKVYDTNEDLSVFIRQNLHIDVLTWDYGENPIIEFSIDDQGKVTALDLVKKRNKYNARVCANDLLSMTAFPKEYRGQTYIFECKPYPNISRREFKEIKRYTERYFKKLHAKINTHWFPDPRKYKLSALVAFDLYKDGHVENVKFLESSNDEKFDKLAKKAIEMSAPFSPLEDKALKFAKAHDKINVIYDFNNPMNYPNQLNRNMGFSFGSFGSSMGLGLGYGRTRLGRRGFGYPWYGGYPYRW